jgi:hypothetical protein
VNAWPSSPRIDRYPSAAALVEALEALPPSGNWTPAAAATWWERFRDSQDPVSSPSAAPTLTITVDLGSRDARPT